MRQQPTHSTPPSEPHDTPAAAPPARASTRSGTPDAVQRIRTLAAVRRIHALRDRGPA